MPAKMVQYDGKWYCWNSEKKEVEQVHITKEVIEQADIPAELFRKLLEIADSHSVE